MKRLKEKTKKKALLKVLVVLIFRNFYRIPKIWCTYEMFQRKVYTSKRWCIETFYNTKQRVNYDNKFPDRVRIKTRVSGLREKVTN